MIKVRTSNAGPSDKDTVTHLPGDEVVIAQMFEWTWDSVAEECIHFLGPAGYGFVQCKPPSASMASLLTPSPSPK